jgi:hypothetical protein
MPSSFDVYLAKIEADFKKGKATEHTWVGRCEP